MLFCRHFTLETDHKPLLVIFGSKKGIPVYTANRLQRWALTLLLYDFDIQYVSTESFGYADLLSRLINNHIRPDEEYVIAAIEMENTFQDAVQQSLDFLPLTYKSIQEETKADPVLQEVVKHVQRGWPVKKAISANHVSSSFYVKTDYQSYPIA